MLFKESAFNKKHREFTRTIAAKGTGLGTWEDAYHHALYLGKLSAYWKQLRINSAEFFIAFVLILVGVSHIADFSNSIGWWIFTAITVFVVGYQINLVFSLRDETKTLRTEIDEAYEDVAPTRVDNNTATEVD